MRSTETASGDHDGNRHGCESDCAACRSDGYDGDCAKNDDGVNGIFHAACGQSRDIPKTFEGKRKKEKGRKGEGGGGRKKERRGGRWGADWRQEEVSRSGQGKMRSGD